MDKKRKLAPGSIRSYEWQEEEYRRMMGEEAAERQIKASANECSCHKRTLRTRGSYRTVHERHCPKYKPWMEEYQPNEDRREWGKAHAEAAKRDVVRREE